MSWWVNSKDKAGRQHIWLIDEPIILIQIFAALFVGLVLPLILMTARNPMPFAIGSVGIILLGYACLVVAKTSLFCRGIWFSWGTRRMSRNHARLYRTAYALMVSGGTLLLLSWRLAA
jgi:hypothetical protein